MCCNNSCYPHSHCSLLLLLMLFLLLLLLLSLNCLFSCTRSLAFWQFSVAVLVSFRCCLHATCRSLFTFYRTHTHSLSLTHSHAHAQLLPRSLSVTLACRTLTISAAGATGSACCPRRCECANIFTRCKKHKIEGSHSLPSPCTVVSLAQTHTKAQRVPTNLLSLSLVRSPVEYLTHTCCWPRLPLKRGDNDVTLFSAAAAAADAAPDTARALRSSYKRVLSPQSAILRSDCLFA